MEQPYFNEPGYQSQEGTPTGDRATKDYNLKVQQHTLSLAMLGQCKRPTPAFKQIIETHFKVTKSDVEKRVQVNTTRTAYARGGMVVGWWWDVSKAALPALSVTND